MINRPEISPRAEDWADHRSDEAVQLRVANIIMPHRDT
jgi:hypothetical protein